MSRARVFIATSLDGFIAGPDDDLSWLPEPDADEPTDFGFPAFFDQVGALLMGRRTHDVVAGFDVEWPYGDRPVLVATRRPLTPAHANVRAVTGTIAEMVARAREAAGGSDVYVDGGALIRSALEAELIDLLEISVVPVILGAGTPLFAGAARRHDLELVESAPIGAGLVKLTYRPRRPASAARSSASS
ncbi:MAG: dihydrofolate reductase [Myxococcales bacterium]|nr:dihydrofolate reductase [Myxococcales bacterium]